MVIGGCGLIGVAIYLLTAKAQECVNGQTKCVGYDQYACINGKWELIEPNSPSCGYVPPECTDGETKCIGYDFYVCINGKWELIEQNSPSCGYEPPECNEGDTKCVGPDLYKCINGKWVLTEPNSPSCTTGSITITDIVVHT